MTEIVGETVTLLNSININYFNSDINYSKGGFSRMYSIERLKKIQDNNNEEVEVLKVPHYYQSENDVFCFPTSIKMCVDYFSNFYGNEILSRRLPRPILSDLIDICKTNTRSGTRINDELIKRLNRSLIGLEFKIQKKADFLFLKKRFDNGLPTIILYDLRYYLYERPGGCHAGVFVGFSSDGEVILNNPHHGGNTITDYEKFNDSWEQTYNRAIEMKPILQLSLEDTKDILEDGNDEN